MISSSEATKILQHNLYFVVTLYACTQNTEIHSPKLVVKYKILGQVSYGPSTWTSSQNGKISEISLIHGLVLKAPGFLSRFLHFPSKAWSL